jgi:hypothetical protein
MYQHNKILHLSMMLSLNKLDNSSQTVQFLRYFTYVISHDASSNGCIQTLRLWMMRQVFYHSAVGNCGIDFFNFCHQKVRIFEISNLFKRNQNFAVTFQSTESETESQQRKCFEISQKPRVIPLKFCDTPLV